MTQTLRRELRKKIQERVDAYLEEKHGIIDWDSIYEIAADAALELRGFQFKPKSIEAAIFAGVPVTDDLLDHDTDKLHDFEKAFGFGSLPWYSNTTWDKFAKWVIKQHTAGWFTDYVQWREGEGKYKAFSNRKIRENPQAFMDTGYPEYEAGKMYRKTDETAPVYAPIPERKGIPNPYKRSEVFKNDTGNGK